MGDLWGGLALSKGITSGCEDRAFKGFFKHLLSSGKHQYLHPDCASVLYVLILTLTLSFSSIVLHINLFGLGENTYRGFNLVFLKAHAVWEDSVYTRHP